MSLCKNFHKQIPALEMFVFYLRVRYVNQAVYPKLPIGTLETQREESCSAGTLLCTSGFA